MTNKIEIIKMRDFENEPTTESCVDAASKKKKSEKQTMTVGS